MEYLCGTCLFGMRVCEFCVLLLVCCVFVPVVCGFYVFVVFVKVCVCVCSIFLFGCV